MFLLLGRVLRALIMENSFEFWFCASLINFITKNTFSSTNLNLLICLNQIREIWFLIWPWRLIFREYLALVITTPYLSSFYFRLLFLCSIKYFWVEKAIFYLKRGELLLVFIVKLRPFWEQLGDFLLLAFFLVIILVPVYRTLSWRETEKVLLFVSRVESNKTKIFDFIGSTCLITSRSIVLRLLHLLY